MIAQTQRRVLLTQNGKDFITQVPPMIFGVEHEGLIWFKYDVRRSEVPAICSEIDTLLKQEGNINGAIWIHEIHGGARRLRKHYPTE